MAKTIAANDNQTSVFTKVFYWIQYSSAVHALHRLDDSALEQMGIKRSNIHEFVKSWNDNQTDNAA